MIEKEFINWIENEKLTQEDQAYLLDKLCLLATKSTPGIKPKVEIYLKSKRRLDNVNKTDTAKYLNMSTRTLSRKLEKESTGFQKLLDQERQRRCLYYLNCRVLCGREIVELLGLSDISHFYRSFKQWTGYSFSEAKSILAENHSKIDIIFHRSNADLSR